MQPRSAGHIENCRGTRPHRPCQGSDTRRLGRVVAFCRVQSVVELGRFAEWRGARHCRLTNRVGSHLPSQKARTKSNTSKPTNAKVRTPKSNVIMALVFTP